MGNDGRGSNPIFDFRRNTLIAMPHNLNNTINVHRQKAEWEEIIPLAKQILADDPGDIPALRSLAEAYEKIDQLDQTIEVWQILVDRHHEVTPYARRLGLALKKRGDLGALNYLNQAISVAIDRKHLSEVEEIWYEMLDLGGTKPSVYMDYAQRLAGRREKERAGELLLIVLESSDLAPLDRLQCLRMIIELLPERQTKLREQLIETYDQVYAERPDLEKLKDLSRLASADSVQEAMQELDRYLKFGEGQFFYHQGWGAGKVTRIDPGQQRVFIDFAKKKEHLLSLEMADKTLTPIPSHDLRALWLESESKVQKMAHKDPIGLIKSALLSMGGKANAKELKDALLERPLKPEEWQKWWSAVSKKLKDDHYIEVTGGALKTFTLREEPESPDQEYARRFRECRTLRGRLDLFEDYRTHRGTQCEVRILSQMVHDLISKASQTKSDSEAIEVVFVAQTLAATVAVNPDHLRAIVDPILSHLERAVDALEGMKSVALQTKWFALMEDVLREQLAETYERLLFDGPDALRDLVAEHVTRNHEEGVLETLFKKVRPIQREASGLFIWFARRLLGSCEAAQTSGITRPILIEHLISLHEVLGYRVKTTRKDDSQELRAQMSEIRQLLKRAGFKRLREILAEADAGAARQLIKTTEGAVGIEDRIRKEITGYLQAHFSHLETSGAEDSAEPARGGAPQPGRLLCLEESLLAKQALLKQLQETDIPTNTRDLEAARQLGDLRENAEYHAAKERQAMLVTLSNTLKEELSRATAVSPTEFISDLALFGAQIRFRLGGRDEEQEVLLLGPWESNPDLNRISYESPLGKVLWGREVGFQGEFLMAGKPTTVTILAIEKGKP
jgi:transcription elongation factor GreA-like protein/transcription elongation GreA/GreB family factor